MTQLKNIPTCELVEELAHREGVGEIQICEYEPFKIVSGGDIKSLGDLFGFDVDSGPARILVVID